MGKSYGQIGIRERCEISRLQAEGRAWRRRAHAIERFLSLSFRNMAEA